MTATTFRNLSLARKVALIPALTLLLMGLMLSVALQMGERNTAALRALDRDVFEPLNRAQTLKDEITLMHTRLFALLSLGNTEADPAAQKSGADAVIRQLDTAAVHFDQFLDTISAMATSQRATLRGDFASYAARVRDTANFAAFDTSYGMMLAGMTDEHFGRLRADLDALVQSLSQRRAALAMEAVGHSRKAQRLLLVLGIGAAVLALLGSAVVGRSIAGPMLRLTSLMNELAGGNTALEVPGADRQDEVGAMARAVEVFRANAIARRRGEIALRETNLLFDAALNSMLQGMVVWSADYRVQLVNGRFFGICGLPAGSVAPGMTVGDVVDVCMRQGLYPGEDPASICERIMDTLDAQTSVQFEQAMRPGLLVRVAQEPMASGGCVVTYEDVTEKRRNEAKIAFMARHDALTNLPNRR
jgi:PAS domain-containing protein